MKVNDWIAGLRANQIPVIGYSRWLTGNSSLHNSLFNGNRIGVTNLSITIGYIWGREGGRQGGGGVMKVNDWIAGLRANQIPVIWRSRWLTGNSSLHNALFNGNRIGVTNLSITIGYIWGREGGRQGGGGVMKVNDWIAGLRANQIPVIWRSRWLTGNSSSHNACFTGNSIGVTNLSITIGYIYLEIVNVLSFRRIFKTLSSIYHGAFSCDCFCKKSSIMRVLNTFLCLE